MKIKAYIRKKIYDFSSALTKDISLRKKDSLKISHLLIISSLNYFLKTFELLYHNYLL